MKRIAIGIAALLSVMVFTEMLSFARELLNMRSDTAVDAGIGLIAIVGVLIWVGANQFLKFWRTPAPKGPHSL